MNRPLKIFVDAHCFDGGFQGSRTFIKGLYGAAILPVDWDVYLGACDVETLKREFPSLPPGHIIRYRTKNTFFRLVFEIPFILRKHKFDFSHFQYVSPVLNYCKYIVTTHDILFEEFPEDFPFHYRVMRSFLFRICLRNASVRTTPSSYCRDRISQLYRIPATSLSIVPNGVNNTFSPGGGCRHEAVRFIHRKYGVRDYILCVNRIEPRKNHELLLESFLKLELYKKEISLVFIGASAFRCRVFLKQLASLPPAIKRFVSYYPYISQEDLVPFYRAARLFVYPSKAEGFGIPPLEAAALGAPVLCADTTAMSAYAFFGDNLFDPADHARFRRKLLCNLATGPDEKELCRISAVVRERYSWDKSRDLLRQALEARVQPTVA